MPTKTVYKIALPHSAIPVVVRPGHTVNQETWEEKTGLLTSLIPQTSGSTNTDPMSFNASKGELKLGPAPIAEELRQETERVLREQAMAGNDPSAQYDLHYARPQPPPGVTSPATADLLPHPPGFKTVDVKREVERVRDARKRIRLEPSLLSTAGVQQATVRSRALPSIGFGLFLSQLPMSIPASSVHKCNGERRRPCSL